jgi:hypothetical protein
MNLTTLAILLVTGALAWWLSGRDPAVPDQNRAADLKRRAWRCGVTLLLVWAAADGVIYGGARGGFVLVAVALPLAILWTGCLSELCARAFHQLIDSGDNREFEPGQSVRELDRLAALVQTGQNEQAVELCARLLKSGEVSALAMDTMLCRIYGHVFAEDRLLASPRLAEAHRLCREGRALEAESRLKELLRHDPQNLAPALTLLRVYARAFAGSGKAELISNGTRRPGTAGRSRR